MTDKGGNKMQQKQVSISAVMASCAGKASSEAWPWRTTGVGHGWSLRSATQTLATIHAKGKI